MPEPNGEIPLTGDPRVDAALKRIRGKFQDLEDAMLVQAHLEKRQSESIKAQAEWLERHEKRIERADILMAEMTEKVEFLLNREMKREGGPEAQG
jgi:hypothetical protein